MQTVFDKLEKHARITRLEKKLGLSEEQHLQVWLDAWEGPEPDQNVTPDFLSLMNKHPSFDGYAPF